MILSLRSRSAAIAFTLLASTCMQESTAQTTRSGSGANAQLLQQVQQLGSERTALQAENERLKRELADLRKQQASLSAGREALERRARSSEAALAAAASGARQKESADEEISQLKSRMQELIGKFRETAQTLQEVETERSAGKLALTQSQQALTSCTQKNTALFALNDEILTRFEQDGVFSRLARAEPFTQLKRTQLENLVDSYRDKASDQQTP